MKKIAVFAGVLAASTLMGASAAWAAPTPGTFYEVNGTFTLDSTKKVSLNCNSGDLADEAFFADATNSNATYTQTAQQTSSSGEPTGVTEKFDGTGAQKANVGDTVNGTLLCLAGQDASTPTPTPSTGGGVY